MDAHIFCLYILSLTERIVESAFRYCIFTQPNHHFRNDDFGSVKIASDEDIQRALGQNLEVVGGQGQTHGEHDDAENDGLSSSAHPVEGMWEEECVRWGVTVKCAGVQIRMIKDCAVRQ